MSYPPKIRVDQLAPFYHWFRRYMLPPWIPGIGIFTVICFQRKVNTQKVGPRPLERVLYLAYRRAGECRVM